MGDIFILHLALYLGLILRYQSWDINAPWRQNWPPFLVVFGIWILVLYTNNLYQLNAAARGRRFIKIVLNSALAASALSVAFFYLNVGSAVNPKTNLLLFIIIFLVFFFIWRRFFNFLLETYFYRNNLAIIGINASVSDLISRLQEKPQWGYKTAIVISDVQALAKLPFLVTEKNIRTIVIADDFKQAQVLSQALFDCLPYGLNYYRFSDFYEMLSGKVPVESIGQDWFITNLNAGQKNYFNFFKKIFDLLFALTVLLISLPFWPLIALAIKINSRGPIFIRQERLGKNGLVFTLIKFRTMRVSDNDQAPTVENDARITRVGLFLRQSRLDEIPQVLNILKGEMSFIGPRPERPEIAAELAQKIIFYNTRLLLKPGLTGWDQISGQYHSPSPADSQEKLQYDLFYLKHRSLYLDLSITIKTIATVLSRSGR